MLPLYKIRFELVPGAGVTAKVVERECLALISDWVDRSFEKGRQTSPGVAEVPEIDLRSHQPQVRMQRLECGALHHAFHWSKADDGQPGRNWVSHVELLSDGSRIEFQLQLGIEAEAVLLDSRRPRPSRPRLVSTVLSHPGWTCRIGPDPVSVIPHLVTAQDVETICSDVLFSPQRELPAVVVTPDLPAKHWPIAPQTLATRLAGTARVFRVRDKLATLVLDQYLGRPLAIGPNAIRVFAPGLEPGSGVDGHWHFLGETIHAKALTDIDFSDFLFDRLAEKALTRFRESPLVRTFGELLDAERQEKLEKIRGQQAADVSYYESYARELEAQNRALTREREQLQKDLESRDEQLRALQSALDAAQQNIRQLTGAHLTTTLAPQVESEAEVHEATVLEVLEEAAEDSPDLLVLESARKSADEVPVTYKFTDRVGAALRALQDGADTRNRTRRIEGGWKSFFEHRGFEYKPRLSDTTRNTWGDDYRFLIDGRRELFEEHFTIGVKSANTCLSIHFSTQLRKDKVVVAYVGRHLRNTQS
ncbi:MAG: TolC family protein [Holophagales bacterium]|nr:MAG: TolC family protein [Holophagales bacterium]